MIQILDISARHQFRIVEQIRSMWMDQSIETETRTPRWCEILLKFKIQNLIPISYAQTGKIFCWILQGFTYVYRNMLIAMSFALTPQQKCVFRWTLLRRFIVLVLIEINIEYEWMLAATAVVSFSNKIDSIVKRCRGERRARDVLQLIDWCHKTKHYYESFAWKLEQVRMHIAHRYTASTANAF